MMWEDDVRSTIAMIEVCGKGREKNKEEGVCKEERETDSGFWWSASD